ncbi:MAG: Bax inhibitor-1 family protein [Bacilli bacterium]
MEHPYQSYASSTSTSPLVKVFTWMAVALGITAVMAMLVFIALASGVISPTMYSGLMIASIITLIISYIWFLFGGLRRGVGNPSIPFFMYAGSMGVVLSTLPMVYSVEMIGTAFGISAFVFGAFAAYGATTKTSLLGLGQFAFVAMLGLILLSFVNLFIGSASMDWFISFGIFGVVLLIVAYQVWFVKQIAASGDITTGEAMYLAFSLYISFINIFLRILRFLAASRSGGRR